LAAPLLDLAGISTEFFGGDQHSVLFRLFARGRHCSAMHFSFLKIILHAAAFIKSTQYILAVNVMLTAANGVHDSVEVDLDPHSLGRQTFYWLYADSSQPDDGNPT